jgi:hypothetical protein
MPEDLEGEFVLNDEEEEKPSSKPVENVTAPKTENKAGLLTNLCEYPSNVTFENQDDDETIILLVRRDLITNVPWIFGAILLVFIPPVIRAASGLFSPFFNLEVQTLFLATIFYYLMVFGFVLIEFIIWFFNVGLVTNKRIIDLDVHGVLSKHFSETKLDLIEDVSYSQVGAIRSVFNYGDVHMQTAGTLANFEFDRAPEPAKITKIVAEMIGGKKG